MKKVLLVDDEPANLDLLKEILRHEDVEIIAVTSGEAALKYAEDNEVDLVISDLVMPGIRGTDLFFKLRQIHPFIQIVLVTAFPSLDDIVQMLESGASDFIIKPIDAEVLILVVRQAFNKIARWHHLRKEYLQYRKRGK